MSADLLVRLNAERRLEARELSDLLNLAQSSAYRYFCDTELRYGQFRTLVHHCRNRQAAEDLLRSITDGTEFALLRIPSDRDLDGDGDVDTDDAIGAAIAANQRLASLLDQLHRAAGDGRIDAKEADDLQAAMGRLWSALGAVQRIVADEADRVSRRRRANPFRAEVVR